MWICASCTKKGLQSLLNAITDNEREDENEAADGARRATYLERQAWDGWYATVGSKARVHYYRAGRSLCHKIYATSLWGQITSEPTGGPCPACSSLAQPWQDHLSGDGWYVLRTSSATTSEGTHKIEEGKTVCGAPVFQLVGREFIQGGTSHRCYSCAASTNQKEI